MNRGEVWLIDFEPQTHKEEMAKTRPALVIQVVELNDCGSVVVVPFSTVIVKNAEPARIHFKNAFLEKPSDLILLQIRGVSEKRFIRKIGALNANDMQKIDRCIKEILGLR